MIETKNPSLLRALIVPWSLASVLFIGLSSALLAFFLDKGVVGVVGSYFLLSWLFKYAYIVLEYVANGNLEAPPVSAEMLGPFEQRPLIQIAWCTIAYLAARALGGVAGATVAALLLIVLPASIAVLGLGLGILQSVNPLALWQIIRGLGWHYFGILGLMAVASILIVAMEKTGVWNIWTIAVAEMAVLTIFSALGGALFERRLDIGHEPISSPERQREKEDREHARQISAMLDEVYVQIRIKRYDLALELLKQWLANASDEYIAAEVHTILDRVSAWRDAGVLSRVTQTLVAELIAQGKSDLARDAHQHAFRGECR